MRVALGTVLLLALCGVARAVPPPGGEEEGREFREKVRQSRERARDEYDAMRADRREAMEEAARHVTGGDSGVPGWKGGEAPQGSPRPENRKGEAGGRISLFTVAGIVIAYLYLRVRFPFVFEWLAFWLWRRHRAKFRRRKKVVRAGQSTGPMVLKLKARDSDA